MMAREAAANTYLGNGIAVPHGFPSDRDLILETGIIADRPGLAPGLIGGMLAANLQMGFLGGILSGFLAGYIAKFVRDKINLPTNFEGLKLVLVIPLLSTLAVGLLLFYVFGTPVRALTEGLTTFLQNMGSTNAVLLGLVLGGMMASDLAQLPPKQPRAPRLIHILLRIATVEQHFQLLFVCNKAIFRGAPHLSSC
jgi:hypothetical protein